MTAAYAALAHSLFPWLEAAFERFEDARSREHLGHAWLLSGPPGMGKINLALALAARLLGHQERPTPLAPAAGLAAIRERHAPADRHPDLHWLHPEEDKDSISVDQVRGIIESLALTAHQGATKVVVIEPAEAMTAAAANALLKTLEQPTANSYLLLVSHQPGRLAATVRSRCQQIKLQPPNADELAAWLGVDRERTDEAQSLVGRSPLSVARQLSDNSIDIRGIERSVVALCEDRLDVQSLAQAWSKEGPEVPLAWLGARLHRELCERLAPGVSTRITVPPSPTLHNAWRELSTRALMDTYDRAEKLLNQVHSGLNVELALQALLSAFQTNRGRS